MRMAREKRTGNTGNKKGGEKTSSLSARFGGLPGL